MSEVYVATQSGGAEIDGEFCPFIKGVTLVEEGHGLLEACPEYFKPVSQKIHYESATAKHEEAPKTRARKVA